MTAQPLSDAALAQELDRIAAEVPRIPSDYAALRGLMELLPNFMSPELKLGRVADQSTLPGQPLSLVNQNAVGQLSASSLGIGQLPSIPTGQANLLTDPTFDTLVALSPLTYLEQRLSREFYGLFTKAPGLIPGTNGIISYPRSDNANDQFQSKLLTFALANVPGAFDVTQKVYTKGKAVVGVNRTAFPYVTAALRSFRFASPWTVPAGVTTCTLTLELVYNEGRVGETIYAQALDMLGQPAASTQQLIAACPASTTPGDTYDVRVTLRTAGVGDATTILAVGFAEPELHYSTDGKALPFVAAGVPTDPEEFLAYIYFNQG
jgi:hypothetical protein